MGEKFGENRDIEKEPQGEGAFDAGSKVKTPVLETDIKKDDVETEKKKRTCARQEPMRTSLCVINH